MFVTVQSLAFATLSPRLRTNGASLLNLSRNIGGSIGISLVATLLARNIQVAHADLAQNVTREVIPLGDPSLVEPARAPGVGRAGDRRCRDQPAGGVHRLSRRFLADDVGDARRDPAGVLAAQGRAAGQGRGAAGDCRLSERSGLHCGSARARRGRALAVGARGLMAAASWRSGSRPRPLMVPPMTK